MGYPFLLLAPVLLIVTTIPGARAGPLHDAARAGDQAALVALLDAGTAVDRHDSGGKTALFLAVQGGHLEAVTLLLARGADPNLQNNSPSGPVDAPIHAAAQNGDVEAIRRLGEAGANLTLATPYTPSPLHLALQNGPTPAADLLEALGAGDYRAPSVRGLLASADVALGRRLARGACGACHALEKTDASQAEYREAGPTLWEIVGRPKAAVAGFGYTPAMRAAGGVWSYRDLNDFLANPTARIPGTTMWKLLGTRKLRAAVIAYLRTLSDDPKPLPD